jgi:hypothetical protein
VPESHVVGFVAAENASAEEVCVEVDVQNGHDSNQDVVYSDKSTSQICHQASWSHCLPKRLRYIPTFHCSIPHSNLRALRA